ncbi:MAG: NADH-quinone oxidoreductase subunit M, partial [Planctomycetes bacterium]|nr:NADH-quinone oxidoreductase subunit M [Planctomycetota bacterium]
MLPKSAAKWVALVAVVLDLLVALPMIAQFDSTMIGINNANEFQFEEKLTWISSLGTNYYFAVDGLSYSMILLTLIIGIPAALASWNIKTYQRGYFAMLLLLETCMLGVFVSLDMILFYLFWEVMLLPMYFLIGIWGGPRRVYAAIKFFLFTLFGSVGML